jgi:hypothetical protein
MLNIKSTDTNEVGDIVGLEEVDDGTTAHTPTYTPHVSITMTGQFLIVFHKIRCPSI